MNIFKILSSGDGRILEPNVSGFLAYLLDPNEDHGLGSNLLERFLEPFAMPSASGESGPRLKELWYPKGNKVFDLSRNSRFDIVVTTEVSVTTQERKRRDVDIVIEIWTVEDAEDDETEKRALLCVLAIENKIREGAISSEGHQLLEQMEGLEDKYPPDLNGEDTESPVMALIFLTRALSKKACGKFKDAKGRDGWVCEHFVWTPDQQEGERPPPSVCHMLRELLGRDATGEVDPIHDSTKVILRSFINFVITDFKSYQEERRAKRDMAYTNRHRALAIEHNIPDRASELEEYLEKHTSVDFETHTKARYTFVGTESHGVLLTAAIAHRKTYSVTASIRRTSAAKADRERLESIARRLELEVHQTDKYACLPDYDRPLTSREEVVEAVSLLKVKLDSLSNE